MRFAALALALIATLPVAHAADPATPTVTLEQAMADPDWIGPSVDAAWWRWDGTSAYYMLKRKGAKQVRAIVLVAAPEGIRAVQDSHPDVDIYTAAIDSHLNEVGYIIPGLGDAGDKIFGTK